MKAQYVSQERDSATKAFDALQGQHAQLISHQNNWDLLTSATEKINMVFNLLENADSEEQKELRHYRDHSKALEDENSALQRRVKDLEAKLANSDRTSATARQSLTQAQQRSSEWERRAKESEGQVEMLQTKLDQAEQTQSQLEADNNMAKMQLEESEADRRLEQVSRIHINVLILSCINGRSSRIAPTNCGNRYRPLKQNVFYSKKSLRRHWQRRGLPLVHKRTVLIMHLLVLTRERVPCMTGAEAMPVVVSLPILPLASTAYPQVKALPKHLSMTRCTHPRILLTGRTDGTARR